MAQRRDTPLPVQLNFFSAVEDRSPDDVPRALPPAAPEAVSAGRPVGLTLLPATARYQEFLLSLGRSRHTTATQRVDLGLLLTRVGDRPVAGVATEDLRGFVAWLRSARGNAARSLRRKVATVKGLFSFLAREGHLDHDPSRELVYPAAPPRLPEVLEPGEAAAVAAAAIHRPLWRALVLSLLDAGLKRDEALALDWADVVLDPDLPEDDALVVRATREASHPRPRRLRLTARLHEALAGSPRTEGGAGPVFPISVRAVNFIVAECGRKAGIRKRGPVTPQMLRDTFAVAHMRVMVQAEAAVAFDHAQREAASLREQHNRALQALLGLAEDGDGALRYRVLASPLPGVAEVGSGSPRS